MNQQDTILPYCKSVKFLYNGVKKLYNGHAFIIPHKLSERET